MSEEEEVHTGLHESDKHMRSVLVYKAIVNSELVFKKMRVRCIGLASRRLRSVAKIQYRRVDDALEVLLAGCGAGGFHAQRIRAAMPGRDPGRITNGLLCLLVSFWNSD